jgi:hypothetical protein|nr:MAG TPA: hypothetical protein [Caudoviricetes sp.]
MTTIKKIQTTSDANGYPTNLKNGYIGFETWAEAEKFAEERDLTLMCVSRRTGWHVWHRGNMMNEPMTITAADYGDDYCFETDAEKYFENEREILEDCDTIEEAEEKLKTMREVIDAIKSADIAGGEVVVTCCGEYCETIKTETMSWRDESNGREYVIAAVELI